MDEQTTQEQPPAPAPADPYDYGLDDPTPAPHQAAPPETAPEPTPQPVRVHPAYLLREARELGFGDEEANSMDTEQLGELIQRINSRNRQQQREVPQPRPIQQPQQQRQSPPQQDDLVTEAELADFDPALQAIVRKLSAKVREQEQTITQLQEIEVNRHNETRNQTADRVFVARPEYARFFGKASGNNLARATDEASRVYFDNRLQVYRQARALLDGKAEDSWEDALDSALIIFMARNQPRTSEATEEPTQRQQEWDSGGVSRPTQRAPQAEPPGPKKARASVAKFLQEQGIPNSRNGEKVTIDDFPD